MKKILLWVLAGGIALLLLAVVIAWPREQLVPASSPNDYARTSANVERGAYLAQAGNCMACHTARGGAPYAGGHTLVTPFGLVVAPNITSDRRHGIGAWSADDFWRALHNGKSRDGRLLYPAFPYTSYTKVTRRDADALFAFMQTVPASATPNQPHALRFPYNQQFMLAAWRLLYFKPELYRTRPTQNQQWNRGAYLVEGLGHCAACHAGRDSLGGSKDGLAGGMVKTLGWYAPSLTAEAEAGLSNWAVSDITDLLKTGVTARATVSGPMAEVVQKSLQHLSDEDVTAMAVFLKSLPPTPTPVIAPAVPPSRLLEQLMEQGKQVYEKQCLDCHGSDGKGAPPHYPALAGNRAVTMVEAVNPMRIVLNGGFAPGTAGNPRPYSMPPYSHLLDDTEVAAVVSYLRASWGNQAAPVTPSQVNRYRSVPIN